jgi:hypothetical protein
MNEWARLVDRYAAELKKYELVCSFCGQHLSDGNINTECIENTKAGGEIKPQSTRGSVLNQDQAAAHHLEE